MAENPFQRVRRFLRELKRRNVYKVAATYITVAFVGLQAVNLLIPATTLPGWADQLFLGLVILGFPLSLVVAWAFEMTAEGVRRTPEVGPNRDDGPGEKEAVWTGYKLLLGLGLLAGAVVGGWYLTGGNGTPATPAGENSIAVLPFEELGQEESGSFTQGMHAEVVTRLSNVSGLTVTSGRAVQRYRSSERSTAEVARELGVRWILTGGVQEMESRIQVNAQLIDPRTDTNVWAEDYQRELTPRNIFAIQEEITRRIVNSLEARLTSEEAERIGRRPTGSLDAYRLYLRGRPLIDQRTEGEIRSALNYFGRAIEEDSTFALAWSGLADARSLLWFYNYTPADSVSHSALRAARRAVELDPDLGEAHASLGIVRSLRHEGPAALRRLERAVELKPSHAEAHIWLSWVEVMLGRHERALEPARRAVELDPLAPAYRVYLAEALLANERSEEALREAREAQELRPQYGLAHFMAGVALHHLGRYSEAESAWEKARSLVPPDGTPTHAEVRAAVAAARVAAGDSASAREITSEIDEVDDPFPAAVARAALGEVDRAFQVAGRTERWGSYTNEILRYFFPETLAGFRRDPRHEEIVRDLNRAWGLNPDGSLPDSVDVSFGSESYE